MTNSQDRMNDLIRKVEALMRKAERTDNEAEAEAFYGKAQQLMSQHNIDEAMLRLSDTEIPAEEVIYDDMAIKRSGFFESMLKLAVACAEANDVRCLVKTPKDWRENAGVRFVGLPSNITKAKMLYVGLLAQCLKFRRSVPDYVKDEAEYAGAGYIQRWRRDFSLGFAARIGSRLQEMKRETERAAAAKDDRLLPVLASRKDEVDRYYSSMVGAPRRGRSRSGPMSDAFAAGSNAANRADLGGGTRVGGGSAGQIGS